MDNLPPQDQPANLPSATGSPNWLMPGFMERTASAQGWAWNSRIQISQRVREQAAAWFRANDQFIRPTSSQGIEAWLVALGIQCASQMPADEAKMRAAAYVTTLADRPGYWFTRATLRAAAEHFKWFPSAAELVDFLKAQTQDRTAQVDGARAIINGPTERPREMHVMEPLGVRLKAIAESYRKHFGPDDPRTIRAQEKARE